jgi:hypothetical protein
MSVKGWGLIIFDLDGIHLPHKILLLADHGDSAPGVFAVLGHGVPTVSNGRLVVEGVLTSGVPAADHVIALVRDGTLLKASIAARAIQTKRVRADETLSINGRTFITNRPLTLIVRSKLAEVSILPFGACETTQVSISAKRGDKMSDDNATGVEDFRQQEAERVQRIDAICGPEHSDIRARGIRDGLTPDQVELECLRAEKRQWELSSLRAERPKALFVHASGNPANPRDMLQAAALMHLGQESLAAREYGYQTCQAARDMRVRHVMDLVEASLHLAGRPRPSDRDDMIRAANFSTYGLSGILGDSANKILADQYARFPSVARKVAKKVSAKDFKTVTSYRLIGRDKKLEELGPAGQIEHATMD